MTRIKICGLFQPQDVDFVNRARPDWCGFVLRFPKSHRNITTEQLRTLRARLAAGVTPVGVFVDQPAEAVAALLEEGLISVAQLHGHEDGAYIARLRALAPGKPIWRAFHIQSPADVQAAEDCPADLVLLDGGQGAGRAFDWSLVRAVRRPYLLAGGLTAENIPEAVAALHPYGVDLSSGVETGRQKDREKILAAVAAARKEG